MGEGHFCWTMLARKDRNILIEQSETLIVQSTTISLNIVDSYFRCIVKMSIRSKNLKFSRVSPQTPKISFTIFTKCFKLHILHSIVNVPPQSWACSTALAYAVTVLTLFLELVTMYQLTAIAQYEGDINIIK